MIACFMVMVGWGIPGLVGVVGGNHIDTSLLYFVFKCKLEHGQNKLQNWQQTRQSQTKWKKYPTQVIAYIV